MKEEYPIEYRLKANKVINETFDLTYSLLASVYIRDRPRDNTPYFATEKAQQVFNNPTGEVDRNLNDLVHEVWKRWIQVNSESKNIDLQSSSNRLMHALWMLLTAVEEYNLGNLEIAQKFAEKAEIDMRDIRAESFATSVR